MATDTTAAEGRRQFSRRPRPHLFIVRLWTEDVDDTLEYRGSVRAVASGAFRGFRAWSDLTAFMIGQMQEDEPTLAGQTGQEVQDGH